MLKEFEPCFRYSALYQASNADELFFRTERIAIHDYLIGAAMNFHTYSAVVFTDVALQEREDIVFLKHPAACFNDIREPVLILVVGNRALNDIQRFFEISHIDVNETFGGEIVGCIRAAVIKGQRVPEKRIGELFRDMVRRDVIFNDDVILIRVERFGFVGHRVDAYSEYLKFRDCGFDLFSKAKPAGVEGQKSFLARADCGDQFVFHGRFGCAHLIVGKNTTPGSGKSVKPDETRLGKQRIGMRNYPGLLTRDDGPVLTQVIFSVYRDRGRLGGNKDSFFAGAVERLHSERSARAKQIVIHHKPVIVVCFRIENKTATSPHAVGIRQLTTKTMLRVIRRHTGYELDNYGLCVILDVVLSNHRMPFK